MKELVAVAAFGCGSSILLLTACSEPSDTGPPPIEHIDAGSHRSHADKTIALDPLNAKEVALFLATYNRWEASVEARLTEHIASDRGRGTLKSKPFPALMGRVLQEARRTQKAACRQTGMRLSRYRLVLHRVVAVKEYDRLREVQVFLEKEISKLESATAAERKAAAEKSYRDLEEHLAPYEMDVATARKASEKNKQRYLEKVRSQNKNIDEYNRNLPPNPTIAKTTQRIASLEEKLNDWRFAGSHDRIRADIVELYARLTRLKKAEQRRKKRPIKPSAHILRGFERAATTAMQTNSHLRKRLQGARDAKASGQWLKSAKANDAKKVAQHRKAISQLESQLKQPRLKQAAKDSTVVQKVIGREKLQSISPTA